MPNVVKYSTTNVTNAIRTNNVAIGINSVEYGPTSTTNFWNGITPPSGGYTIYVLPSGTTTPSIVRPNNDTELIYWAKTLGSTGTTALASLTYLATRPNTVAANIDYSGIVTSGLTLLVDAGYTPSFPKGNSTWYDISDNGNDSSLLNGPVYTGTSGGGIVLDGIDDYVSCGNNSSLKVDQGNFTIISVARINSIVDGFGTFFFQSDGIGSSPDKGIFFMRSGNNSLTLDFYFGGTTFDFGTNALAAGTMQFIAVKFNRASIAIKYFRNGTFSTVTTGTSRPNFTSLSNTYIGRRYQVGSAPSTVDLSATVFMTLLYNRELADSEITEIYNAQKGRFGL